MSEKKSLAIWQIISLPLLAWAVLCLLLGLTTALAYLPMGIFNLPVSLAIAAVKVGIIAIIFMELVRGDGVNRLASVVGVLWLIFLFLLVFADYLTR